MVENEKTEMSAQERAWERLNVRAELDRYEGLIAELKVQFEQYFSGIIALSPDKLHNDVKRMRRLLATAPFKNSEMNFRYQTLENRYNTYRSYWERVLREREAGTYQRDIYKAELREKHDAALEYSRTAEGRAVEHFDELYRSYCSALQEVNGKSVVVDKGKFRETILLRAKEMRARKGSGGGDLSFSVEVRDGKVRLIAASQKN
jgi:hypothetical protein